MATLLLALVGLSACQLDAERRWPVLISWQTATATPRPTSTPTSTQTPTPTFTFTPSPTPTQTPTPSPTPISSERLAQAQRAYTNGDYATARTEFEALLADPGAEADEQRLALHWRGRSELQLGDTAAAIATLTMFLQQYPDDELARATQFNLGVAYEQAGLRPEAMAAYRGSLIPDDPINAYIYERIGDAGQQTTAYTETIEAYQAGIEAIDLPDFKHHLHEKIALVELSRDNPAAAITQYEAILADATEGAYRAKILRLAGEAHLMTGDAPSAYDRYLEAVNNYPQAHDSYLALIELVKAQVPVDEFQRGLVDYYAGAYEPAIAALERYLAQPTPLTDTAVITLPTPSAETVPQTAPLTATATLTSPVTPPQPAYAPEALWLIALSWQGLGGYNNAISYFRELINTYPTNPNWGKAHLEIGNSLINQNNFDEAKAFLRDFAAQNPANPAAPDALWRAARLDFDSDLFDEAYTHLVSLAQTYPTSDYAVEALYWGGQAAFKLENYEDAVTAWTQLVTKYPHSTLVSFGDYWRARAMLELGRDDEAEAILTELSDKLHEYYGLRAQDLLSGVPPHTVPLFLPSQAQLDQEQDEAENWLGQWLRLADPNNLAALSSQVQTDPAFRRGHALLELGLRDEALGQFETVKDNWWHDALAMYQLSLYFRDKGLSQLSIVTAARVIFLSPADNDPTKAPLFIQRLFHPIFFADVIFAEAEKYQLDPALILSIMRQESLFEHSAESSVGARGLMQVMPATGEYVAERSDFNDSFNPDQLWLPYLNIKFGTWYIDQQLGIFDGDQFAALAAYNAGPGNVLEWIKVSDDLDIFVESIPFRESRLYIRNIYVNLAAYRRLYGASAAPLRND